MRYQHARKLRNEDRVTLRLVGGSTMTVRIIAVHDRVDLKRLTLVVMANDGHILRDVDHGMISSIVSKASDEDRVVMRHVGSSQFAKMRQRGNVP